MIEQKIVNLHKNSQKVTAYCLHIVWKNDTIIKITVVQN